MDKKILVKRIQELLELDYKPIATGAGAIRLEKKNVASFNSIYISYRIYPGAKEILSQLFLSEVISGYLGLNSVENILQKYFNNSNLPYRNATIHHKSNAYAELFNIGIEHESDIPKVIPYLQKMVYDDLLPFFNKFQTVELVNEELERLGDDISQVNKFIFSPQPIRRMIIKRLVNDPHWEEFGRKTVDNFIKNSTGPYASTFAPFAQFLPELFQELQEMKV